MQNDSHNDTFKTEGKTLLTEEQLKENQKKLDEYDRILRVAVTALGIMFGIIVCIVAALVISNT